MSTSLFNRNLILALAALGLTACGNGDDGATKTNAAGTSVTSNVEQAAQAGNKRVRKAEGSDAVVIIASGTFDGRSDHVTKGEVSVIRTKSGFKVILGEDFFLDGAPDPSIAFGNGKYIKKTDFTKLKSNKGQQEYLIPTDIDPNLYSEVYIWCKKFSVPLGVATLEINDLDEALDDTYGS